ncbi:MAG: DMT family transporter [Luteibaculum sp.]
MPKTKSYLLLHFTVLLFGFTGVLGKLISLPSSDLVWYRMLIASVALGIYLLCFKKPKIPQHLFGQVLGTGGIIAAHWIFFFEAIKQSNVSVALVGVTSSTLFTGLLAPLFYKKKLVKYEIVLGILVMLGIAIIFQINTKYHLGLILSLVAAALASLFTLINERFIKSLAPSRVSFWEMLGGWACITFYFLFAGKFDPAFFQVSALDWMWLLILGVLCTGFAFVASIRVMEHLPAFTVSISINLEPIYAIILAFILFSEYEMWNFYFVLGSSLIIGAILLNSYLKKKELKKSKVHIEPKAPH